MKFWEKFEAYRGVCLSIMIFRLLILLFFIEGLLFCFIKYTGTIYAKTGIESGVYVLIMFFGMKRIDEYKSFGEKNRVLLTYKNAFEIYKTFYLIEYIYVICFLIFFSVGEKILASYLNYSITALETLCECILDFLVFSIVPLLFTMKNKYVAYVVMFLLIIMAVILNSLSFKLNLITVVITAGIVLILSIFTNKRWLKLMKNKYLLKNCK